MFSLLFRHPEGIETLKRQMGDIWEAEVARLKSNYAEFRQPNDPPTFEQYMSRVEPEAAEKAAMNLAQEIIDNQRLGPTINNFRWHRHSVEGSRLSLLASDRAVHMPKALKEADAHIALPIGPKLLFIAARGNWFAERLRRSDPTRVVKEMNRTVVSQARRYVWGVDDRQLQFVQNHMSSAPDRVLITDEQKRAAINA